MALSGQEKHLGILTVVHRWERWCSTQPSQGTKNYRQTLATKASLYATQYLTLAMWASTQVSLKFLADAEGAVQKLKILM